MKYTIVALSLLIAGLCGTAMAIPAPEIDPGTGINALALLGGALVVVRSIRRK